MKNSNIRNWMQNYKGRLNDNEKETEKMKNYIYTVLKDFARNYTEKHGVRPSKWDCMCYMNGYNPDESIHNIFEVLNALEDEHIITYSIPADGWGH